MRVAITGATGFVGKELVKKHTMLDDEVHILSRRNNGDKSFSENIHHHLGDLSNINELKNFLKNIDVLYHCAAEIKDETKMVEVNVIGTENLLKAAKNNIKHWVQLSSVGVYGPITEGTITEEHDYNPINEYERTKLKSDHLVSELAESSGFTYTIIRPSNIIGKAMTNKSIFQLISMVDKGLFLFVGKKGASANYVPVENVVNALYLAATKPKAINQVYIISSYVSMEDFIGYIAVGLNRPKPKYRISKSIMRFLAKVISIVPNNPLTVERVEALSNRSIYSIQKIKNDLGYEAVIEVVDSTKKLISAYKEAG